MLAVFFLKKDKWAVEEYFSFIFFFFFLNLKALHNHLFLGLALVLPVSTQVNSCYI